MLFFSIRSSSTNLSLFFAGVTDSKAVTGSKSTLDLSVSSSSSLVVIVTGIACGIVLTVLIVCLLITCQRKKVRSSD